jgi:hypothetical protein
MYIIQGYTICAVIKYSVLNRPERWDKVLHSDIKILFLATYLSIVVTHIRMKVTY